MAKENPFEDDRDEGYRLAFELSNKEAGRILDFGCGNGYFISKFRGKIKEIYACEADPFLLTEPQKQYPFVKFIQVVPGRKLFFPDSFFDIVFMITVLEHVRAPGLVLKELARVLKKGGQIIIYVPHHGLLTPLDMGNFKFYFPKFHRYLYSLVFGKKKYQQEFIDKKKIGMFGDFTLFTGMRHRHFRQKELEGLLLNAGFCPRKIIKFSLFLPIILVFQNLFEFLFRRQGKILYRIRRWDNGLRLGSLSYNMIVLAEKK
jgi:SAM-dependent methyltransferase